MPYGNTIPTYIKTANNIVIKPNPDDNKTCNRIIDVITINFYRFNREANTHCKMLRKRRKKKRKETVRKHSACHDSTNLIVV